MFVDVGVLYVFFYVESILFVDGVGRCSGICVEIVLVVCINYFDNYYLVFIMCSKEIIVDDDDDSIVVL